MSNIVGIDLGTTMSAIAVLNSVGKPEIVPNKEGERLTPSVIFYENNNKVLIGQEAKNQAGVDSDSVAKEFKRLMDNQDYRFNTNGKDYSAIELSSLILKKLAQDASSQIGEIKDVVISVPAYFKEIQRNSTLEAGKLAGLNVVGIINEPTAAALFYASNSENCRGKGLIYDLGGGTFDVTLVESTKDDISIITSAGDAHLGGIDFDRAVFDLIVEKYEAQTNGPLFSDDDTKNEFLLEAEDTKKSLSSKSVVKRKFRGDSGNTVIEISQSEFEEKISTYISRTELLVEQVLDDADCEPEDVDYILLVGGSTRIPAIQKSIESIIGKEPINAVNVDEAVALGAAIKAGQVLVKEKPSSVSNTISREMTKTKVKDVTNHSFGTISLSYHQQLQKETLKNSIIIEKDTSIPCSKTDTFYTLFDGQEQIEIKITQGEGDDPDFVDTLGSFTLEIPSNTQEGSPIEVTYSYDENGAIHCHAKHPPSGRNESYGIDLSDNMKNKASLDSFLID